MTDDEGRAGSAVPSDGETDLPRTEHRGGADGRAAPSDLAALIAEAYPAIRRMAAARGRGGPVEATSLANEAVCRLLRSSRPPKDSEHLKAMAAQSLSWLITDRLRARGAARRREQDAAIGSQSIATGDSRDHRLPDVAAALEELSKLNSRAAEVFVLAALAEMTHARIGEHLGIDERTVRRDFRFARALLAARCAQVGVGASSPENAP